MNKKGFTLVELLAVISILAIIAVVATVSLGGIRNNIDLKIIESNFDLILVSAKNQGDERITELMNSNIVMSVSDLKAVSELDIDMSYDNIKVQIYLENRRASACINNKDSDSLSALSKIIPNNIDDFEKYYCK